MSLSNLIKDRLHRVGGLFSCQIYLILSFLFFAESTLHITSSTASVYLPCAVRVFFLFMIPLHMADHAILPGKPIVAFQRLGPFPGLLILYHIKIEFLLCGAILVGIAQTAFLIFPAAFGQLLCGDIVHPAFHKNRCKVGIRPGFHPIGHIGNGLFKVDLIVKNGGNGLHIPKRANIAVMIA